MHGSCAHAIECVMAETFRAVSIDNITIIAIALSSKSSSSSLPASDKTIVTTTSPSSIKPTYQRSFSTSFKSQSLSDLSLPIKFSSLQPQQQSPAPTFFRSRTNTAIKSTAAAAAEVLPSRRLPTELPTISQNSQQEEEDEQIQQQQQQNFLKKRRRTPSSLAVVNNFTTNVVTSRSPD